MWDGPDPLWETTCQNWFGSRLRSMWSMWFHTHTSHLHLNRLRYWLEMELSEPDYKSTESAVREPSIHSTSLLLSHFSRVRLCATPQTAAHQAPPSLEFSRQKHWRGLPFPSPMHESEKWKWSRSVVSNSSATPWTAAYQGPPPHGLFQARVLEWVAINRNTVNQLYCNLKNQTLGIFCLFQSFE